MAKSRKKDEGFEEGLLELEAIVARLEGGDTSLEESLDLFEKGTARLKSLAVMLDEAEKKVDILTRDMSGEMKTVPFDKNGNED
ncbi:MAG TPA: exodeoxyribonuclease VII small subunit [Proteobacteria bacterium]|nr:exodeoxyribonuclease 7 small subunit [bacterium BMS3Abin14]HDL53174.1 exodeoxyribonuclease VII small subunit [Pseudomonadota bacterium]